MTATLFKQVADNAVTTTATVLTSTGITSIVAASGAVFPAPGNGFFLTIWTGAVGSDPASDANMEIVTCTARSTNTLTVSATTKTHASPVNIGLLVVAQGVTDLQTAINGIENGTTQLAGLTLANVAKTANYTATSSDSMIRGATASGAFAITLPTAVGISGRIYMVKKTDSSANILTINTTSSQTIDGVTTFTLTNINQTLIVQSDNANWVILSNPAGVSSIISNEVPGGTPNGSITAFTTASAYATGSLRVSLNGQRLIGGGADYTETASGFTMAYAPITGDLLIVDYHVTNSAYTVGTNSNVTQEVPTGLVNSSNTVYTTARAYIAGTVEVFKNRTVLLRGADFTETTPGSGIITLTVAPTTGDSIWVNYQYNLNPSSNADTVDGVHASTTFGQDGFLVPDYGGWQLALGTYTFSSATVMNTPSDLTGYLAVGDKIRWKHAGGYLYGYIITISTTQITLATNTDYSVANSAISSVYVSKAVSPQGFPQYFNFTSTWTSAGSNPTQGNGTLTGQFSITGKNVTFNLALTLGTTTSTTGATAWRFSLPTAADLTNWPVSTGIGIWFGENPAVIGYGGNVRLQSSTTCEALYTSSTVGAQTIIGNTTPATWASTWWVRLSATYKIG